MNEALEQMRRIEEQIRELANDLDWLEQPIDDEPESGAVKRRRPEVFASEAQS